MEKDVDHTGEKSKSFLRCGANEMGADERSG